MKKQIKITKSKNSTSYYKACKEHIPLFIFSQLIKSSQRFREVDCFFCAITTSQKIDNFSSNDNYSFYDLS